MYLSKWGEVRVLNIRQWLGYEIPESHLSEVDLKLDEILNQFQSILGKYCDIDASLSLAEIEKKIDIALSDHSIYQGFVDWFTEEGKVALIEFGRNLYKDDEVLVEELNYLKFILSSEINNVMDYPDDVIGTLVDITDQLDMLLSSANKVYELRRLSSKIVINPEDIYFQNYFQQDIYGHAILGEDYGFMEMRDSYNYCENPFYIH